MSTNLSEETFKPSQPTEKIHYKGELRIVGQVVNSLSDKEPIAYVIMVEKTKQFKVYNVAQTISLLQRFKFVNADLENGDIINTECSMKRMPKFNTKLSIIDNFGILVLGEITNGTEKIGYRVMDANAKIVDLTEIELLNYANIRGVEILNAKIVSRNNKQSISAIKQEFTKIEKSKLSDTIRGLKEYNKPKTPEQLWRNQAHIDKLVNVSYPRLIRKLFKCSNYNSLDAFHITDDLFSRNKDEVYKNRPYEYRYIDLDREYNIMRTEILKSVDISETDKDILSKLVTLPHKSKVYTSDKMDINSRIFLFLLAQFALYIPNCYKRSLKLINNSYRESTNKMISTFNDKGLCTDILKKLLREATDYKKEMVNIQESTKAARERREATKRFKTTTFNTAVDIADLGFAISETDDNKKYETRYGFTKTLRWIGRDFKPFFNDLKNLSRCFGDLAAIAYINKLLDVYGDINEMEGQCDNYSLSRADVRSYVEIIICIAYMFDSVAMKKYVEDIIPSVMECWGIDIRYEDIAGVNYNLDKNLTIYYASGFNVFLNDDGNYKKDYLRDSKYINYRQLGIKHDIKHPLLQNELASVVSMISSENLDTDTIASLIGKLRFL